MTWSTYIHSSRTPFKESSQPGETSAMQRPCNGLIFSSKLSRAWSLRDWMAREHFPKEPLTTLLFRRRYHVLSILLRHLLGGSAAVTSNKLNADESRDCTTLQSTTQLPSLADVHIYTSVDHTACICIQSSTYTCNDQNLSYT